MGTLVEKIEKQVDPWPFNTMSTHVSKEHLETYVEGFNRAKKQAANLAAEADELMDRMLAALEDCAREDADRLDAAMAKDTVEMYYKWKERTK